MDHVESFDGTPIAYTVTGTGPAVLLLHGFAADQTDNWVSPGVVDALVAAGRQVIATDARGHGQSGKPHEPDSYAHDSMIHDATAVLDHLDIELVDVVGYSMGSMVSARLVADEPRARSLILGGVGGPLRPIRSTRLADALETDDAGSVENPVAKAFRTFADRTGADRQALAAIVRSSSLDYPVAFERITVPTLVLIGDKDALVGSPTELADQIAGARVEIVSGDHLTAVFDPAFPAAIVTFLDSVDAESATPAT